MLDVFITSRVRRKIVVVYAKYPDFKTHVRGLQAGDAATGAGVGAGDDARCSLDTFATGSSGWYASYHGVSGCC